MSITSASSFEDVVAEYRDTASYLVDDSAATAKLHAVAIRHLLVLLPSSSTKGSNTVSFSMSLLQDELKRAEAFAISKGTSGHSSFIRADFGSLRDHG